MITVVTGPPCGGKTTFVRTHRRPVDLVLDLDQIAHALGYPTAQLTWGDTHPAVAAARRARTHLLRALLAGEIAGDAWVIDTRPDRRMLAQYARAGAVIHVVDPGEEVAFERALERADPATVQAVLDWYAA